MKKILFFSIIFLFISMPLKAIDPVLMTSSAPKALELAAIWSPHTINAMQSGGLGLVDVGKSALSILYLPLGVVQCTLGFPFGYFDTGIGNCIQGGIAPFELVYHVILLPIRLISLGAVR